MDAAGTQGGSDRTTSRSEGVAGPGNAGNEGVDGRHTNPSRTLEDVNRDVGESPSRGQDIKNEVPGDERMPEPISVEKEWDNLAEHVWDLEKEEVKRIRGSISDLLIFAGLFAGVLTAFAVQYYTVLVPPAPDYNTQFLERATQILERILSQIDNNSTIIDVAVSTPSSTPTSTPAIPSSPTWVASLWFISLVLVLASASIGIAVNQWLSYHVSLAGVRRPGEQVHLWCFRYAAYHKWRVTTIINIAPVLLQSALLLFLVGLVGYLWPLGMTIAAPTLVLVAIVGAFQIVTAVIPSFTDYSPFKSAQAQVMRWSMAQIMLCLLWSIQIMLWLVRLSFALPEFVVLCWVLRNDIGGIRGMLRRFSRLFQDPAGVISDMEWDAMSGFPQLSPTRQWVRTLWSQILIPLRYLTDLARSTSLWKLISREIERICDDSDWTAVEQRRLQLIERTRLKRLSDAPQRERARALSDITYAITDPQSGLASIGTRASAVAIARLAIDMLCDAYQDSARMAAREQLGLANVFKKSLWQIPSRPQGIALAAYIGTSGILQLPRLPGAILDTMLMFIYATYEAKDGCEEWAVDDDTVTRLAKSTTDACHLAHISPYNKLRLATLTLHILMKRVHRSGSVLLPTESRHAISHADKSAVRLVVSALQAIDNVLESTCWQDLDRTNPKMFGVSWQCMKDIYQQFSELVAAQNAVSDQFLTHIRSNLRRMLWLYKPEHYAWSTEDDSNGLYDLLLQVNIRLHGSLDEIQPLPCKGERLYGWEPWDSRP